MPLALGLDLGTTTITAVALDTDTGLQAARVTTRLPAGADVSPRGFIEHPRSEWDATAIARTACACLRELADQLPAGPNLVGLAITGQQHGVVLIDEHLRPVSPLINWQDRRGEERYPGQSKTWVEVAQQRLGEDGLARAGCRMAPGFMGLSLFWLAEQGKLPQRTTACFIVDWLTALLVEQPPVTDATCAASAGLLDVFRGDWDRGLIQSLGLPREMFPPVRPCGEKRGVVSAAMAGETGLAPGLPVFVGLGDNQASFLGSVGQPDATLVNVGTGGQVAVFTPAFASDSELETRPFPGGGFLLVAAGLVGGASYAVLERFFRAVGSDVLRLTPAGFLYDAMTTLAALVPPGADGLRCEPFFHGTRLRPELRANWTGLSSSNFTPGHLARALLEGMARTFAGSEEAIRRVLGQETTRLVGAGNGIRDNPLLARIISSAFHRPMLVPRHREEAATGAALVAAVGAGVFPDLASAGRLILHDPA
jgi:sugar (pentulose or hexulose) kinase